MHRLPLPSYATVIEWLLNIVFKNFSSQGRSQRGGGLEFLNLLHKKNEQIKKNLSKSCQLDKNPNQNPDQPQKGRSQEFLIEGIEFFLPIFLEMLDQLKC